MKQGKECKRCGNCCCNFPIREHEATRIKKYLYTRPDLTKTLFRPFNHEGCIFLLPAENDTWKCAIYDSGVRPTICKVFGTKGIKKLSCPENYFVGTKYTRKQAYEMISKDEQKSKIVGMMNDIMIPFIAQSVKENIIKSLFPS